jgi:hypothetical protein
MENPGRARHGRKQTAKTGDAEGLSRRDVEPCADIVQRSRTDPTHPPLDGMQNWKQQVTTCAVSMPSKRESPLEFDVTLATTPSGHGLPQDRIHGPTLFARRLICGHVNIQFGLPPPNDCRLTIVDCRLSIEERSGDLLAHQPTIKNPQS